MRPSIGDDSPLDKLNLTFARSPTPTREMRASTPMRATRASTPARATPTPTKHTASAAAQLEALKTEMLSEPGFSLQTAYNFFDTDRKNGISQLELEAGLDRLNVNYTHEETGRMMTEKGPSGKLEYPAFCKFMLPAD